MCGGVRGVWRECGGGGVMFGFLEVGKIFLFGDAQSLHSLMDKLM